MRPSLFIGRWQPFHDGHKTLIETVLNEGKDVVIACRNSPKSESDPYTFRKRRRMILRSLKPWQARRSFWDWVKRTPRRVEVILIPDIGEVVYGRKVGYGIRELSLDEQTESISATAIRATKSI